MSTRATFRFIRPTGPAVTVYVPFDGYPEGAALSLHRAVVAEAGRQTRDMQLGEAMIRRHECAELWPTPRPTDPTEFQYTVTIGADNSVRLTARQYQAERGRWEHLFAGELDYFIARFSGRLTMGMPPSAPASQTRGRLSCTPRASMVADVLAGALS